MSPFFQPPPFYLFIIYIIHPFLSFHVRIPTKISWTIQKFSIEFKYKVRVSQIWKCLYATVAPVPVPVPTQA